MSETLNKKQRLPWWRRILLGLVLAAMAVLSALILVDYLMERQLGAEITKISQAAEPITFLDLQTNLQAGSTGEDASRYYDEALSSILPGDFENLMLVRSFYRKNIISLPPNQFPGDMREKIAQSLDNLQPVLDKFDKGAAFPLFHFDIGIEQGIQVYKTRLDHAQTAISLLSLRTLDLLLRGEDDAAVDSVISMLKMIRIFDPHPTMVVHAAKVAFLNHACQDIHLLLECARPSDKSLAKLQKVLSQTIPANALERMFFAERAYQIEIARDLIPQHITSRFLQDNAPDLPRRLSLPASRWGRIRLRRGAVRYLRDMAQLITAARRPWPQPLDTTVTNAPQPTQKSKGLLSSGAAFVRLTAGTLAFVRCTTLAVAIERYHRSHGELPPSLDALSPAYINSLPSDPFTGNALLYKRNEDSFLIYSTGINRKDDGGSITIKADDEKPQDLGLRIRLRERNTK